MDYRAVYAVVGAIVAIFGAIIGVYIFLFRHVREPKKHPCSDDLVYKDVCQANQNCLEGEIKNVNSRLTELKTDLKDGFTEVKALIRNGGRE